jgi:hypothetical protein
MNIAMMAGGTFLVICILAAAVVLSLALVSKDPKVFDVPSDSRLAALCFQSGIGLAVVGWCAVILLGVNSLLSALIAEHGDPGIVVGAFVAFVSLPVLVKLGQLPRLRYESEVHGHLIGLVRQRIERHTEVTETEVEPTPGPSNGLRTELSADDAARRFAAAIRARDQWVEKTLMRRLEREARKAAEEQEAARVSAERAAAVAARAALQAAHREKVLSALAAGTSRLPVLPQTIERVVADAGEVLVSSAVTARLCQLFIEQVAQPVPTSLEEANEAARTMQSRLIKLEGVFVPGGMTFEARYRGHPMDGFCDLFTMVEQTQRPLVQALRYEASVPGLCNAFLLAAVLPSHWSWGHGCYDRDHIAVTSSQALQNFVLSERSLKALQQLVDMSLPPAGLRIRPTETGFAVACVATRVGRGLYDLSLTVENGIAGTLEVRELCIWGAGVFY